MSGSDCEACWKGLAHASGALAMSSVATQRYFAGGSRGGGEDRAGAPCWLPGPAQLKDRAQGAACGVGASGASGADNGGNCSNRSKQRGRGLLVQQGQLCYHTRGARSVAAHMQQPAQQRRGAHLLLQWRLRRLRRAWLLLLLRSRRRLVLRRGRCPAAPVGRQQALLCQVLQHALRQDGFHRIAQVAGVLQCQLVHRS